MPRFVESGRGHGYRSVIVGTTSRLRRPARQKNLPKGLEKVMSQKYDGSDLIRECGGVKETKTRT